jgi:hypothetical protein
MFIVILSFFIKIIVLLFFLFFSSLVLFDYVFVIDKV